MRRNTPQILDLAARLIAFETTENSAPDRAAAALACERMRPHLATLMGQAGFRAVLTRALAVASTEVPWLKTLQVTTEGSLQGSEKPEERVKFWELTEGGIVLIAQLLGLLVAFIGDNLTLHLVRDIWPNVSLENLNFNQEDP